MTIPVKWFTSDMTGAPQLAMSGTSVAPGGLITVLDACLLNGFNTQGLDNLTYDSGTNEATATVSGGHGFLKYQVVLIEGANEPAFNGEHRLTVVDATTFKFTPSATPPATATGTITAKAAPIGQWEKAFSGTDKAAYRSTDPLATGFYLRLDDTATAAAKPVSGYESMTDVDTGTNMFGNYYFAPGGSFPARWAVVGDSRLFYCYFYGGSGTSFRCGVAVFGDIESFKPADAYQCVVLANGSNSYSTQSSNGITRYLNSNQNSRRIARSSNISNLDEQAKLFGTKLSNPNVIVNPNPADGNFYISDAPLLVMADSDLRGTLPGIGLAYNDLGVGFHVVDDASPSPEVFLVLQEIENTSVFGQLAFNLTGAWR